MDSVTKQSYVKMLNNEHVFIDGKYNNKVCLMLTYCGNGFFCFFLKVIATFICNEDVELY
jgi:hypothetical protein